MELGAPSTWLNVHGVVHATMWCGAVLPPAPGRMTAPGRQICPTPCQPGLGTSSRLTGCKSPLAKLAWACRYNNNDNNDSHKNNNSDNNNKN